MVPALDSRFRSGTTPTVPHLPSQIGAMARSMRASVWVILRCVSVASDGASDDAVSTGREGLARIWGLEQFVSKASEVDARSQDRMPRGGATPVPGRVWRDSRDGADSETSGAHSVAGRHASSVSGIPE